MINGIKSGGGLSELLGSSDATKRAQRAEESSARAKKIDAASTAHPSLSVDISSSARLLADVVSTLKAQPEVRAERVAAARQRHDSRRHVSAADLANSIVNEELTMQSLWAPANDKRIRRNPFADSL